MGFGFGFGSFRGMQLPSSGVGAVRLPHLGSA